MYVEWLVILLHLLFPRRILPHLRALITSSLLLAFPLMPLAQPAVPTPEAAPLSYLQCLLELDSAVALLGNETRRNLAAVTEAGSIAATIDYQNVDAGLAELEARCPALPQLAHNRGVLAARAEHWTEAVEHLERALSQDRRAAETQKLLQGIYDYQAAEAYARALDIPLNSTMPRLDWQDSTRLNADGEARDRGLLARGAPAAASTHPSGSDIDSLTDSEVDSGTDSKSSSPGKTSADSTAVSQAEGGADSNATASAETGNESLVDAPDVDATGMDAPAVTDRDQSDSQSETFMTLRSEATIEYELFSWWQALQSNDAPEDFYVDDMPVDAIGRSRRQHAGQPWQNIERVISFTALDAVALLTNERQQRTLLLLRLVGTRWKIYQETLP